MQNNKANGACVKRKLIIISLISGALGFALMSVWYFKYKQPQAIVPPTITQSEQIIAPSIIDGLTDLTRIPTLQPGIIEKIHVSVGQHVKKGEPLCSLDSKLLKNTLKINMLGLKQTKNALELQKKQLAYLKKQLARLQSLDKRAISQAELQDKVHDVKMANAQLTQAKYALKLAIKTLKNTQLTLAQYTMTAPKDGIILQINTHTNEFVGTGQPIMYLGDAHHVIVRVSIDEREAHRFKSTAPAYLINYENAELNIPLTFIQLDQYIVTQERLNSRVQEALYSFDRNKYPYLIAGQLFDAYIAIKANS